MYLYMNYEHVYEQVYEHVCEHVYEHIYDEVYGTMRAACRNGSNNASHATGAEHEYKHDYERHIIMDDATMSSRAAEQSNLGEAAWSGGQRLNKRVWTVAGNFQRF